MYLHDPRPALLHHSSSSIGLLADQKGKGKKTPTLDSLQELWKDGHEDFFWLLDNFLPCVLGCSTFDKNFVITNQNLWSVVSPTDIAFVLFKLVENAETWEEQFEERMNNKENTQQKSPEPSGDKAEEEEKQDGDDDEVGSNVSPLSKDGSGKKCKLERVGSYLTHEENIYKLLEDSATEIEEKYHQHRSDLALEEEARQQQETRKKKGERDDGPQRKRVMLDLKFLRGTAAKK